jgi:hypothetical protein
MQKSIFLVVILLFSLTFISAYQVQHNEVKITNNEKGFFTHEYTKNGVDYICSLSETARSVGQLTSINSQKSNKNFNSIKANKYDLTEEDVFETARNNRKRKKDELLENTTQLQPIKVSKQDSGLDKHYYGYCSIKEDSDKIIKHFDESITWEWINESWQVTENTSFVKEGIQIQAIGSNRELIEGNITWVEVDGTYRFHAQLDNASFPLTEFGYRVYNDYDFQFVEGKLIENYEIIKTQFTKVTPQHRVIDFNSFLEKEDNTLTSARVDAFHNYESADGIAQCVYENPLDPFAGWACLAEVRYFDISFEGEIWDTDPELYYEFDTTNSISWQDNRTEGTLLGERLIMNSSSELILNPVYENNSGEYTSLVFHNTTSTYWNITQSIADSDGSAEVSDLCQADANCVSYWSLDGNYLDSKGSNDGTAYGGVTNATGLSSGAMNFNGVDSKINFTSSPINGNEGSLSFWMQTNNLDGLSGIIGDRGSTGAYNIQVRSKWDGAKDGLEIQYNGQSNLLSNSLLDDGTWKHILITWDNQEMILYVNNKIDASNIADYSTSTSTGTFKIGTYYDSSYNYEGSLDEILIYNKSLTASEITELYKAGLSQHADTNVTLETRMADSYNISDSGLVGLWGLNGDANDETGRNNGTEYNNVNYTDEFGIVGQGAYVYVDDYIEIADDDLLDITDALTFTAWIKPVSYANGRPIIEKFYDGSANSRAYYWTIGTGGELTLGLALTDGSNIQSIPTSSGMAGVANEWVFVSVTWDKSDGKAYYYKNGEFISSGGTATQSVNANLEPLKIGVNYAYNAFYSGNLDEIRIYNRSLSQTEIQNLYELGSYHIEWNDWEEVGVKENEIPQTTLSGGKFMQFKDVFTTNDTDVSAYVLNYTIGPGTPSITDFNPPTVSNFQFYALNSSKEVIGGAEAFNTTNLEEIEYMNITFTMTDETGISGDMIMYFTANGTNACSLGNKQSITCYNEEEGTWIEYQNGTETGTFKDEGNAGDYIDCDYAGNSTFRNYTCQIDEHYNPNVFKWYDAGYNFSDVKWQDGADQRITKNQIIKVEINDTLVPTNSDQYKIDFRVDYTIGTHLPNEPLEAYACNSSYTVGDPEDTPNCALVATKLPSELQDDGTKFRAIITQELLSSLNNIKYIILEAHLPNPTKYYFIKSYGVTTGGWTTKWEYSTNDGDSFSNLGDNYETELNINWFSDGGTEPTEILFKIFTEDTFGNTANSSIYNMTWNIDATQNYPPITSIENPGEDESINGNYTIDWTTAEPNNDETNTTIYLNNGTNFIVATNLANTTTSYLFDTTTFTDGTYNLTVSVCENNTAELYCSNDTHLITITQAPEVTIIYPENTTYTTLLNEVEYSAICSDTCLYAWYSLDGGVTNSTPISYGTNFTSVPFVEGGNDLTVWVNCTVSLIGSDSTTFTIDLPPTVSIDAPLPGSNQNQIFSFQMSCTDTVGVDTRWYNWLGTNYTYTSSLNLNNIVGNYDINAWCNDTYGSLSSTSVNFDVVGLGTNGTVGTDLQAEVICPEDVFGYYNPHLPSIKIDGCASG